jgi:DNA processing protein
MRPSTEWSSWLALRMVRGVGNVVGLQLIRTFGSPAVVMGAKEHALLCAGVRPDIADAIRRFDAWGEVERRIGRLDAIGGRLVTWADESYPEALRHVYDAPLFLFVRGEILPSDAFAVALVGTREPSDYGRRMARSISEDLVRAGVTVVSGLARGIDAEAHAAALRAGGRTIAVLGCGIDVVYPSEHHRLQMHIARHGAVVSEFSPGMQPDAEHFPTRNRIISGMSLGTVVVEATEKSGSLITAELAVEQGREVFAVPGPVGSRSRGPHRLLRQGATLAETAEDVLRELAPRLPLGDGPRVTPVPAAAAGESELAPAEAAVLDCLSEVPIHVDPIVERTGLSAQEVLQALLSLELRGAAVPLPGKRFTRHHSR